MRAFFILVVVALTWWLAGSLHLISPLYLPPIDKVIFSFNLSLVEGIFATVIRTVVGFILGVSLAYLLHFLSFVFGIVNSLDAQFAASRSIPGIALMPLFILWFGFGELGRIIIVSLTATMYFIAPLQSAFHNLPREWTILKKQMALSSWRYYRKVIMPGVISELLGAFRLTLAISLTVAVASDYMGSQVGIGKFIDSARVTYNIPAIFLALIVAAIVGLGLDQLVLIVYKKVVHWSGKTIKA